MLNKITEFAKYSDYTKINIKDKHEINYVEFKLIDYRIDILIFNHYGYNVNKNYNVSSELLMFLIYSFNDFHDLLSIKSLKLPNINELLQRITIDDNDTVNGVISDDDVMITNDTEQSKIVNELVKRVNTAMQYDKQTGKLIY